MSIVEGEHNVKIPQLGKKNKKSYLPIVEDNLFSLKNSFKFSFVFTAGIELWTR